MWQIQNNEHKVLMVGDGLNEVAALRTAHVSMAPGTGSDIGQLAADLIFTGAKLQAVIRARSIAKKANKLIQQNFILALMYNCIAVPLALAGQLHPWPQQLQCLSHQSSW